MEVYGAEEMEKNQFLFTKNNYKSHGDIVLIQVHRKLRNEIMNELKKAFPEKKKVVEIKGKKIKKENKKTALKNTPPKKLPPPKPKAPPPPPEPVNDQKVYDQISSVIIEEIKLNHILLRGRKTIPFKKKKRLVEIQALVARRDIGDNDKVSSKNFIESNVIVIQDNM